jgi:sugar-specific transcriptional regulator TrmB
MRLFSLGAEGRIFLKIEERLSTLKELGLTIDEAKIYLTLVQEGPITAKEISRASGIARPYIYRIVADLMKGGAVEAPVTKPAVFKAVSAENLIPMLLERKMKKQKSLKEKTIELLSDLQNNRLHKLSKEPSFDYTIVPGREVIIKKLKDSIYDAEKSVYTVTSKARFSAAMFEFEEVYQAVLNRGVKIKLAVEKHVPDEKTLIIVRSLTRYPNFKVKYFNGPPPAIVSIWDDKKALVTISATAQLPGTSALWSSNPSFIELAQNYFEKRWKQAVSIDFASDST